MNDKKQFEIITKKNIKDSLLKYSNTTLFERREKFYKSDKKDNNTAPKFVKTTKNFGKKIEESKEIILYPFCQTMSSFHSLDKSSSVLPLLDFFDDNTKKMIHKKNYNKINLKNKTENKFFSKMRENKTVDNFYITETSTIKIGNKHQTKNISFLLNKENNKKNDLSIDTLLLLKIKRHNSNNKLKIRSFLPSKNISSQKYYSYIKTDINKNNLDKTIEESEIRPIMDLKTIKFNNYKPYKFKDFIKKTQDLKLKSYTIKTKKERAIRLEEGYYNQIEFYQDTINSLKSAQKLLDVQFSNKIADYTRFIMSKKEREKVKSSKLIQEIINHKKEIDHIKNKINKIEIEKSNILKWIYFMIKMKEKRLVLPNYYKNILERTKEKRLTRRQPTRRDKNKSKIQRKNSIFRVDSNIPLKEHKDTNKEKNEKNEKNTIEHNTDNSRKDELERILLYKNTLIFQTPEEFQERLANFEKDNITLLTYYNDLYRQIYGYTKELDLLKKEEKKMELKNLKIKEKEKELIDIKILIEEKKKLLSKFKKREENSQIENKKEKNKTSIIKNALEKIRDTNFNFGEENNLKEKKNNLLFKKISVIFEICKMVGNKLAFVGYILNLLSKRIYTKEKQMLLMLEFIEQTIDYLISYFKYNMNKNEETQNFIKNVKSDIEKKHKIEKARLQMMIDMQKINILKEKIEKRSNKIYILPSKKIDMNQFKIYNRRKILNKNKNNRIITIEDFLYNEKNNPDNK